MEVSCLVHNGDGWTTANSGPRTLRADKEDTLSSLLNNARALEVMAVKYGRSAGYVRSHVVHAHMSVYVRVTKI